MSRKLIFFLLLVPLGRVSACDMCNCYLGLNPHYKKNIIGLRSADSFYYGSLLSTTELEKHDLSKKDFKEIKQNYELMVRYYPVQKFQLQLFIPYVINSESMSDKAYQEFQESGSTTNRVAHLDPTSTAVNSAVEQSNTIKGLGDPIVLAQYQLFNTSNSDSLRFQHRLFAGAGIKFPLGKSRMVDPNQPLEKSHQPGTGSWDFLPAISYLVKYKRLGCNLNINYMLTNADKYDFQIANNINANLNIYRECLNRRLRIFPSVGFYFEQAGKSRYKYLYLEQSGGVSLLSHLGCDFYYKKISLNMAIHLPLVHQMNGTQPELSQRLLLGINYSIN